MTLLTLVAGAERYGIDVRDVQCVVPRPRLRPLAGTPPWVAGVFSLSEQLVPVIDLCLLHGGPRAHPRLSTRVIVARYPLADGSTRGLGLMAEHVTDVIETDEDARPSVVAQRDTKWLGGLVSDDDANLVQVVSPMDLLPDEVQAALFPQ
jgi:chemotaxis-related protein WspB